MKTVVAILLLAVSPLLSASVLFQVISLDCGFCAQFESNDGVSQVVEYASQKGFTYRVGALGPLNEGGERPYAHPEVYLFFAAAKLSPENSPHIAETFYRYYSEIAKSGIRLPKEHLIDQVAIAANISPGKLSSYLGSDLKSHFQAWRKTATILQGGMEFSGKSEVKTPAFVLLKDGKVVGYQEWQGDVLKTISAVKSMVRRVSNED